MEGREISEEGFLHRPVLLREVVENLNLNPGKVVVDCTVGTGGHAEAILERILPGGFLLGIDLDKGSILFTEKRLNKYGNSFRLIQNNFREIKAIMEETGIEKADGFLLDLGVSSYQLNDPQRGFSFRFASPLDMRMNLEQKLRAFDLVNHLDEYTLIKILENNAQERFARRIAHEIISARKIKNIENTTELVEIVLRAIP
ncbi:MAG: 16S rRNA (cytosine(1402)-N(4))-methyltransferase RsmH, partial [Candidatus Omnitrophica bacterium]|nr:16S rRNA (cytosine(1402)-N(4))-methyltransferase RsmH [Candidatus Omnitrophota bacterium]